MSWVQFMKIHWDRLTVTGLFAIDVATLAATLFLNHTTYHRSEPG